MWNRTECGNNFSFDPVTRKISGTIKNLPKDGKVSFIIPGKSINYSSSWKSTNKTTVPNGWWERITGTNQSEQSFIVE